MNIDHTGNAAYAARFEYFSALRVAAVAFGALLVPSVALNLVLFRKPPVLMVVRVDDAGRAQALTYRGNDYTPREAEIVAALNQWALSRFRLTKPVLDTDFKANYYFLDARLARELAAGDADVVAKIDQGTLPEQDVRINSIRFRSFDAKKEADGTAGTGECVIDMSKSVGTNGPVVPEHWVLTLRYRVNPTAAAMRARQDVNFQLVNPLGVTITWFHEDRAFN
jgi:type IV secretion system protein VirB5